MARKSRKETVLSNVKTDTTLVNRTGVYLRLSIADNGITDGNSIDNQRNYVISRLSELADINIEKIYTENGHTGTTYERAVWQELISDIMAGKINCIAVKDFSRMGRNLLETSNYLEKVFPFLNVRVISLNDNFDSSRENFNRSIVEACFKNLMNECYSRDISKKICDNTFIINDSNNLKNIFINCDAKVGVSAGASTPQYLIEEILSNVRAKF